MSALPNRYPIQITVNDLSITTVLIGRHYLNKHGAYMDDELILRLVMELDGGNFLVDSTTAGVEYFVADIALDETEKIYRLIWLFEGEKLEVLGVINAYRKKGKKKL